MDLTTTPVDLTTIQADLITIPVVLVVVRVVRTGTALGQHQGAEITRDRDQDLVERSVEYGRIKSVLSIDDGRRKAAPIGGDEEGR